MLHHVTPNFSLSVPFVQSFFIFAQNVIFHSIQVTSNFTTTTAAATTTTTTAQQQHP